MTCKFTTVSSVKTLHFTTVKNGVTPNHAGGTMKTHLTIKKYHHLDNEKPYLTNKRRRLARKLFIKRSKHKQPVIITSRRIAAQLRRVTMTLEEKKLRRAILRIQTGKEKLPPGHFSTKVQ